MGIGGLGVPELLIILAIVIVLFGASRLAGVGSAMGSSIREFRRSVKDEDKLPAPDATTTTTTTTTRDEVVRDSQTR